MKVEFMEDMAKYNQKLDSIPIFGDGHQSILIGICIPMMFEFPHGMDGHKPWKFCEHDS
jgi:hypothetical protein